jgi:Fe-S-cluster-containing dehydrogenase component
MKKWNLIIDVEECHNCNNCFIACKDEYVGNDIKGYSAPQPLHGHKWINIVSKERGQYPIMDIAYVPTMCNHCDDAPCVKQGNGAVEKREDGIVLINPQKAVDRKDIVDACPYGAIWWNEELSLPQAWTFDAHLLDRGWKEPRGVQSCPTAAMKAVKITDQEMARLAEADTLEPLRPDLDTRPRVYYKNLHRYSKVFVAGEVLASVNEVTECLAGAKVVLTSQGKELAATETDTYGEFKIDGLEPGSGSCTLSISHEYYATSTFDVVFDGQSVVTDSVMLENTP